jgi:hypothetical protein
MTSTMFPVKANRSIRRRRTATRQAAIHRSDAEHATGSVPRRAITRTAIKTSGNVAGSNRTLPAVPDFSKRQS